MKYDDDEQLETKPNHHLFTKNEIGPLIISFGFYLFPFTFPNFFLQGEKYDGRQAGECLLLFFLC